jgi:hypothetical protein
MKGGERKMDRLHPKQPIPKILFPRALLICLSHDRNTLANKKCQTENAQNFSQIDHKNFPKHASILRALELSLKFLKNA